MASKPSFKQAYMNTYIGELPSIINYNFEEASTAINSIVEYGDNTAPYMKLPVKTSGNVKANTGYFKNIQVEDSLKVNGSLDIDISAIAYDDTTSLRQKFDNIDASIQSLIKQLELGRVGGSTSNATTLSAAAPVLKSSTSSVMSSLSSNDANLYICALKSDDSYTYSPKYYMMNNVIYDAAIFKCKADYIDVVAKDIYRYYNVYGNKYVKVNNDLNTCFRSCKIGDVVIPILDATCERDFIISMGDDKITISYEDYQLVNVQLICTNVDDNGKCTFKILDYNGKISIAK